MGHIQVDSPHESGPPEVLTIGKVNDTLWRFQLLDGGVRERKGNFWYWMPHVRPEELMRMRGAYSYSMGRWEFSEDVNTDNVAVRFFLPNGELFEIPAIPEGGDYCPRRPVQVLSLPPG